MMQSVKEVESWYEATVARPAFSALEGAQQCDVCVVGGGLAGLTVARACAERGLSVVLLEAGRMAGGASGRNGGFVSSGFARSISEVEGVVGAEAARALYALSAEGTAHVRDTIAAHAPDVRLGSGMRVCVRHEDGGALEQHGAMMVQRYGETVAYAGRAETRAVLDTARYFGSLVFAKAFHIHPLRYGLLVARLAQQAGARLHEQSAALAVNTAGAGFVVGTSRGRVAAQHVVHCVSALDRKLHGTTCRAMLPVATYVAVTEPLPGQRAIRTAEAVADTRRAGDYYRLLPDSRVMWGGKITTRVSEPRRLADEMRRVMLSTFPTLGQPRIDFAWAGIMGYALHKMPLIGRAADGQWYCTAFGGHGLNTTAMGGLLVARAIADGDDAYRRFAPFAPRWAFGLAGRAGVQATYWWMQARDRRDESRAT